MQCHKDCKNDLSNPNIIIHHKDCQCYEKNMYIDKINQIENRLSYNDGFRQGLDERLKKLEKAVDLINLKMSCIDNMVKDLINGLVQYDKRLEKPEKSDKSKSVDKQEKCEYCLSKIEVQNDYLNTCMWFYTIIDGEEKKYGLGKSLSFAFCPICGNKND